MQKKVFTKPLGTTKNRSDLYWLAWECLRTSGETVKTFGAEFLDSLSRVEVLDDEPLS
jgi:hypothetical protein